MKQNLHSPERRKFSKFVRACALLGACLVGFLGLIELINTLTHFSTWIEFGMGMSKGCGFAILTWFFWYAYKHGQNPFSSHLFTGKQFGQTK